MTLALAIPDPIPPGFDEREAEILRASWREMVSEALTFKLKGQRSGTVRPEVKIHRGRVTAASITKETDLGK